MNDPIVLIGVPKATMDLLQRIARKTGESMADVLSEAIDLKARKHLTVEEYAPP